MKKNEIEDYIILHIVDIKGIRKIVYDFDKVFKPSLSERVIDLNCYAEKLYSNAIMFAAFEAEECIGFIAFYANDRNMYVAYITQIAVKSKAQHRNIGKALLDTCVDVSKINGMKKLKLAVINSNSAAINFYKRNGFEFCGNSSIDSKYMIKNL